ncbi:MAG: tRNA uridine(34) 5-carboxymethylaminomethyl modification radical SAM/GNAT enzyme Elp3 [Patescibacteria group bacterium]|nr:tRNA uridine(34) 5-carboxymethylaminomethyl modification radical SAM/GNAT enzyme Elp3 [Patescibacteria group bacterium]
MNDTLRELVKQAIEEGISDQKSLQRLKHKFCAKYEISAPSSMELIKTYHEMIDNDEIGPNPDFLKLVRKRGVRSLSGIASVTAITKEYSCPGNCIYCPNEEGMPKSYLSNEPACMRAILNDFDAYKQVRNRIRGLERTGHPTDKIEVIVSGGSFTAYPSRYQTSFTLGIYNALNYPHKKVRSLKEAQKINEKAKHRCVGLSFETRPDEINEKVLKHLREYGCTKIELGVQTLFDEIYRLNNRGHDVDAVRRAFRLCKDAGFKINAHMMPNLYGSDPKRDYEMFELLFNDSDFRPDWLKIYPCLVLEGTALEKLWKQGKFEPYTDEQLIKLLEKIKAIVPKYVRITRLYRDIPAESILAGSKISNLRQMLNVKCNCIRCREVRGAEVNLKNLKLNIYNYKASQGEEFFLTFDDVKNDKLCALLRLRFPFDYFIKELKDAAIIRELHTYGLQIPISEKSSSAQHLGLGKKLVKKAEEIAQKAGYKKIAVISGVGVRSYYRKLGYKLEGTYMVKNVYGGGG